MNKTVLNIFFLIALSVPNIMAQKHTEVPLSDLFSIQQNRKSEFFSINEKVKQSISRNLPKRTRIPIMINGQKEMVLLKKQQFLSQNYVLRSAKNEMITSSRPIFYSGIVAGQNNSTAFLAIHNDDISLSIDLNESKWFFKNDEQSANQLQKVLSEAHHSVQTTFICDSNLDDNPKSFTKSNQVTIADGKVSIYIQADHHLFLQKGSSIPNVEYYIQSVFAQVAHIYANEDIDIEISEIKVWDTPDPYDVSTSQNGLTSFRSSLTDGFNGDLAHLLSGNSASHGGKAYIDVLCDKSKAFAYSNLSGNYEGISDYSWDAFIIAHEMGHNFGSYHTHECVWGPEGNQAIDVCGRTNESCNTLDPNPTSGTIMSYCHLDPTGISFAAGFGQYPGDLIRNRYNASMANAGINCETAIEITENGKYTALGPVKGFGASQSNADHSNWFKFTAPTDGKMKIFNCLSGIDSRLWIHSGDCEEMIIVAHSDDTCGNGGSYDYSSSIPQLVMVEGETIFIEWDDRWSDEGFDFYFKFGSSTL